MRAQASVERTPGSGYIKPPVREAEKEVRLKDRGGNGAPSVRADQIDIL